jgi:hypothetical protein
LGKAAYMKILGCWIVVLSLFAQAAYAELEQRPLYQNLRGQKRSVVKQVNINQGSSAGVLLLLSSSMGMLGTPAFVISDGSLINKTTQHSVSTVRTPQPPMVYPNPMNLKSGGEIDYFLPQNMDLEVYIYNMLSNLVYKNNFRSGAYGAQQGVNVIRISEALLGVGELSAGAYIVLFVSAGKLVGKAKFAVVP